MDDFFRYLATDPNAKVAVPYFLWGLFGLIVLIILLIVVGFFQGRSFTFWQVGLGESPKKKVKSKKASEEQSFVLNIPHETEENLETIIDSLDEVVNAAVDAESDRFWRMLNLLQGIHVFDNSALLKLCNLGTSPHEVWKKESSHNTRLFREVNNSLQIAMKAISTVTTGDDFDSTRRASIALRDKNNYLYIIARDHYSKSHENEEKFFIGDNEKSCGVAGYVAYSKKPMRVENVLKEIKFVPFHNTPKYKSLLCVPITVENFVLGTFSIDSTAENAYTQEEEQMAMVFANTIATSIIALMIRNTLHSK